MQGCLSMALVFQVYYPADFVANNRNKCGGGPGGGRRGSVGTDGGAAYNNGAEGDAGRGIDDDGRGR